MDVTEYCALNTQNGTQRMPYLNVLENLNANALIKGIQVRGKCMEQFCLA